MKVEKIGAVLEMGRNKIEMEKFFYGCKGGCQGVRGQKGDELGEELL